MACGLAFHLSLPVPAIEGIAVAAFARPASQSHGKCHC